MTEKTKVVAMKDQKLGINDREMWRIIPFSGPRSRKAC